jgi:plasmid maintenance system antidote protein VapI
VKQGELHLLALLPPPRDASEKTVRRCDSEQDAIAVALCLSRLSQAEVARRMGISRSYLTMLKTGERVMTTALLGRLCVVTGSNVVRQYRALQSALRIASGHARQADRIAEIASHTMTEAA